MRLAAIGCVAFWILVVGGLTGCGLNASVYPVTGASHQSEYNPRHVKCLWGNCGEAHGS